MKLDIEALAREAEIGDSHGNFIRYYLPEIKAFARLIVERCAAECDGVYYQNIGPAHGGVRHGIASCSAAIRQLLEDK